MSALVSASAAFSPAQLAIIKKSVAPDTNNDEFDLFVETCKLYGLNPMKRQISARVYSKDDPKRRKMAIVTEIGGFRAIAASHGNYRPDDEEPRYFYDPALKDANSNPLGLERVAVSCFMLDSNGIWQRCVGVAYWDEFAPLTEEGDGGVEWVETGEVWEDSGKPKKKKVQKGTIVRKLDSSGNWPRMPRLMLAKCAEAQALRKGWPEKFSGLYEGAELDRADTEERSASEVLQQVAADDRLRKIGGPKDGYAIQWDIGEAIVQIAPGQMFDRIMEWARSQDRSAVSIQAFRQTNKFTLQRYWADTPNDALALKAALDKREAELVKQFEAAS